nr:ABC transporter ATP-binding protein [Cellulosimicrobium arenosum]
MHVRAVVPERGVNVELDVAPGEVVAILGDNGAGKSTLVQVVAGLLDTRTARGSSVVLDGTDVSRAHARERHVAWVSQRPLLFAHLSVEANAAFGPRARGASRGAARELARGALGRVGIVELAGRRATDLSGGQAQRASVARALATDPDVLLLDEPLASLDVGVAQHVRTALHDAQRAQPRTTLLVTHDLLDVLVLADRVVVLEAGRVVEDGPAADVVTRPRSRFAARLAGVNLLAGTLESVDDAVCTLAATGARVVGTAGEPVSVGDPAVAVFEPRAVGVHRTTPEGSPRNAFAVVVTSVEPHGPLVRVWGRPAGGRISDRRPDDGPHLAADLTPRAVVELRLAPGERVWFVVKAAEVGVHRR